MSSACRIGAMERRIHFLLSAVAALYVILPGLPQAQSQEEITWYEIEMIIFERSSEIGRNAEVWPVETGLPDIAGAVELSVAGLAPEALAGEALTGSGNGTPTKSTTAVASRGPMPRAFQLVPPQKYRLKGIWSRLQKSSAYRPLLHIAWIQPGYASEDAQLVHVRNGNAALGAAAADSGGIVPALNEPGYAPTLSARIRVARDRSKAALDGTVRVHRARYLHVQADLLYYRPLDIGARAPIAADENLNAASLPDSPDTALTEQLLAEDDAAPRLFRLTESRRMRSRELHYLDHPLLGVLVEAWPVELPEAAPEAPQATLPANADVKTDEGSGVQPVPPVPSATGGGSGG